MNLGAVFCVGNLTCSFHMLHTWPTQFYVGPPTLTFLATLVLNMHTSNAFFLRHVYKNYFELWPNLGLG